MDLPLWLEIFVAVAMVTGTFLMIVAAVGLVRFPDIWTRMHAAGKAGTLGVSLMILASILFFAPTDLSVLFRGALAVFFQFLTTPAATHLLARASYVTEYPISDRTAVDELRSFLPVRPDEGFGEE